ncbi:hypothetical protein FOL47_007337 [Perkinsus chesapeaki]|uniref:CYTH domain-containing protein n=1 Tax=Perkinsus chesapeaki TaxID=330153 RepID=A0A7J6MWD0_PERCH|nr:hypothetical protein FOL47_007337 [Perkinsus chesapeaki]
MPAAVRLEVERKISLPPKDLSAFLARLGAAVSHVVLQDAYWDDDKMTLVRQDQWLRLRNGRWEMKVPGLGSKGSSVEGSTTYNEIEGEANVRQFLFPNQLDSDLQELLDASGFKAFAELTSHRTTYHAQQDGRSINIDVDLATFPKDPVPYSVIELEVLSEPSESENDGGEKAKASDEVIDAFMEQMGIAGKTTRPRSKLVEYLVRHDRDRIMRLAESSPKYRKLVRQLLMSPSDAVDEHAL